MATRDDWRDAERVHKRAQRSRRARARTSKRAKRQDTPGAIVLCWCGQRGQHDEHTR